ncbi:hypothetical protein Pmani_002900 [Petrolisthes manimaculis]|uniref:phosphoethanolamine N-methyltransferase n=1 Tax=Petrolisthes manimaculis TaxID=1843537 RepID=A0AAE1UN10_9EUCA|nr:hypothetical protein Pmani_002900 [Petrolisthes manimaculis]
MGGMWGGCNSWQPNKTREIRTKLYLSKKIYDGDQKALSKVGVVAGWQVLVVGCGTGALVFHIASTYGADVLGVNFTMKDFNAAVFHQCSPDIASLILFEMTVAVEEADNEAECFDVILIQETQVMMKDTTKLFANIQKWLKPSGDVFLVEQNSCPDHLPSGLYDR